MSDSAWTPEQVAQIGSHELPETGVLAPLSMPRALPDINLWDYWPVQTLDGEVARFAAGSLWVALSAPITADPLERHALARLRLLRLTDQRWHDCGLLFPAGFTPGSREWSGSTLYDEDTGSITQFFTAAGRRGDASPSGEQRLMQASGRLIEAGADARVVAWTQVSESVRSDGEVYVRVGPCAGEPGTIKAFRDPAFFRDPADGGVWLLFTASLGASSSAFNGAIGAARADDPGLRSWTLLPPLLHADGLNNELERPHILLRGGFYYLFWSTQHSVFAPDGPHGPTGLYGMASKSMAGPWLPLNGSGLIMCNPVAAPGQAYSWQVLPDLSVTSFIDLYSGSDGKACFGGTPAPVCRIELEGLTARLL